eukprot:4046803-Amphidinium_carterae.1
MKLKCNSVSLDQTCRAVVQGAVTFLRGATPCFNREKCYGSHFLALCASRISHHAEARVQAGALLPRACARGRVHVRVPVCVCVSATRDDLKL